MSFKTDWLNEVEGELHRLEMAINAVPHTVPDAIDDSLRAHLEAMKTEVAEYRAVVSAEDETESRRRVRLGLMKPSEIDAILAEDAEPEAV